MMEKTVKVNVSRSGASGQPATMQTYVVPLCEGMSVLGALDYIYENLDNTLAYYDHSACAQGICKTCLAKINGKAQLMCQTLLEDIGSEVTVEPLDKFVVVRDVVTQRGGEKKNG